MGVNIAEIESDRFVGPVEDARSGQVVDERDELLVARGAAQRVEG